MAQITILSPHRDDAVFSLAVCLNLWLKTGADVQVVNFFTQSAYAPRALSEDRSSGFLSSLRRREDRLALRKLNPAIEVRDLGMLDAPVRCALKTAAVSGPDAMEVREEDVAAVVQQLRSLRSSGIRLAPLGLGNHVDHLTVREAALQSTRCGRLGFYEDLPYATWTSEKQAWANVRDIEMKIGCLLKPLTVRQSGNLLFKRRLAGTYTTQIGPEDADLIARFLCNRKGERIWVPRHSAAWSQTARQRASANGHSASTQV